MRMAEKRNSRRDFTQIALAVFEQAVDETTPDAAAERQRLAKSKAGAAGGAARRSALTPEERTNLARMAATARWKKTP